MTLSKAQIEQISERLLSLGAPKFYEILVELTDDVATDVEQILHQDPSLDFEMALDRSMSRFKRRDFQKLKLEKRQVLNDRYSKTEWRLIREWFTLPKVLVTIFGSLGFAALVFYMKKMEIGNLMLVMMTFFFLPIVHYIYLIYKSMKKNRKYKMKFFLLSENKYSSGSLQLLGPLMYMPTIIFEQLNWQLNTSFWFWWYQCFFIVLFWILFFDVVPRIHQYRYKEVEKMLNA